MIRRIIKYLKIGKGLLNNSFYLEGRQKTKDECDKRISRTEVINYLISTLSREVTYLEIGVRNPNHNFNLINADIKYSVDPGLEFKENPVDFKVTSDEFFKSLRDNKILSKDIKFDIIFIDGLHLANQVNKDIENALKFIREDGYIVLHDCNPPTEWHSREEYRYPFTPAQGYWNGTTWKAFFKYRKDVNLKSCCVDSDWGIGILSKTQPLGKCSKVENEFYDYNIFNENRINTLNLITFNKLQELIVQKY